RQGAASAARLYVFSPRKDRSGRSKKLAAEAAPTRSRGVRPPDYSAASGAPMLPLLYRPERSKQHARRMPDANLSQAVSMRFTRVSAFLPEVIQWIQSRRATGVMSDQVALAAGFAASALRRSAGTLGSGSTATGAISSATVSPTAAPAASRSALSTLSQWLPWPSGSSVAWNGRSSRVPSTVTMLRVGSFALALAGRTRNVHAAPFGLAGRSSFALKPIFFVVFAMAAKLPPEPSPC